MKKIIFPISFDFKINFTEVIIYFINKDRFFVNLKFFIYPYKVIKDFQPFFRKSIQKEMARRKTISSNGKRQKNSS